MEFARRLLLCALAGLLALAGLPARAIDIVIAYEDKAQPPYYLHDTPNVPASQPGAAVELIQSLESRIPGLRVKLVRYPWKRCLDQLGIGAVDGIFNASFQEARLSLGAYPMKDGSPDAGRRITTIAYSLYTDGNSPIEWTGTEFSNMGAARVVAPLGYSIVADLRKLGVPIEEVVSSESILKQLAAGRIAAAVLQDVTADSLIASNPQFANLRKHPKPIVSKSYYLMLSRQFVGKNSALAERIWSEVGTLRETTLPRLLDRYRDH